MNGQSILVELQVSKKKKKNNQKNKIKNIETGYNIGELPHEGTLIVCKNVYGNELNITTRARKITKEDFYNFEYIFCMDKKNLKDIISFKNKNQINNSKAKIQRLGDLLNDEEDIEDPYCRDIVLFENVFKQVEKSLEVFFENFDKKK